MTIDTCLKKYNLHLIKYIYHHQILTARKYPATSSPILETTTRANPSRDNASNFGTLTDKIFPGLLK